MGSLARTGRLLRRLTCAGILVVATWSATGASGGRAVPLCTFANGYQHGPAAARTTAGTVISLYVENTRGRRACRFHATLALSLLGSGSRTLLDVSGNPGSLRQVDRTVPRGAVLRVSWLWGNWCRRPLTAVGDLASGETVVVQRWVGLLHSPTCANRRRTSRLVDYHIELVR